MKLKEVDIERLERGRKVSDVVCLNEMMRLFDCFESHDFDKKQCKKQSDALESCYSEQTRLKREYKAKSAKR